ncbi:uncharacterized protein LOC130928518 isoform X2 [Corythoichthys intestinalis]|uniref:uncharacterized protein LOC130928518 isoform X2 n=1 Tax=Corythoichthys intestinalis TaxID=161448 RepID=UPI0025A55327|nr:uncharacterized protein LOC130928518 isoform X2 [Corythoichthys intestinalis]
MVESTVNQALLRCNYMNRLILKRKSRQAMTDDGTVELSQLCSHQETKTPPPPLDGTWGSTCAAIRRFDGTPERCVGARDLHTGLSLSEKCTGSGSSRTAYFMRFGDLRVKNLHWTRCQESRICIGQGDDAGTFVWCCSSEIYQDDCRKKTSKFPQSFKALGKQTFGPQRRSMDNGRLQSSGFSSHTWTTCTACWEV